MAGDSLHANECIVSPSGQYVLYMATDGNFFIYDFAHGIGTWGPGTYNHPGAFALMQSDGNFVVYDANGAPLWASNTFGSNANQLDMQDDGRIILYAPIWTTNSASTQPPSPVPHPAASECTDVGPGTGWTGVLLPANCFVSPSGQYKLYMQPDGGLVLYDRSATPMKPLWANND